MAASVAFAQPPEHYIETLLCQCHNVEDVLRSIEQQGPRLSASHGATALHVLAVTAAPLPKEERRKLIAAPAVNKLLLQLGTQLAGTSDADVHGMTSILWALALLEQADCPVLQGLVNRLMLLITRGNVSTAQIMVTVQALAQLKLLAGSVGAALAARVQARLLEFSAPQLGTLARFLAEALGSGAELLLRDMLAKRADSFLAAEGSHTGSEGQLHAGASLLLALSAAALEPAPPTEFVESVCDALQTSGIDPARLALPHLSQLLRGLQRLAAADHGLGYALDQELRDRIARIPAANLEAAVEELTAHGPGLAPAVALVRERQALMKEQLRQQLAHTPDEQGVLRLLRDPLVGVPQLVVGLARLATLVQACPDPEAWASSLTASHDFGLVLRKLEQLMPSFEPLQMREALCSLASLRVKQPSIMVVFGEQIAGCLHTFNTADAARCMWAFCTLSLLQAPAYPQMMRSIEKHLNNLPAELLCELINAIVPLGRAAACARLLPKLTDALAQAAPKPPFELLLRTSRALCAKAVLPEPLLLELRNAVTHAYSNPAHVAHECSGEGEGSLSGNLTTQQIVVSLWLFVRHLPTMQAQAPFSPLTPLLPPLIERLLLLITDLASLPANHLCDVLYVLARLQRSGGLLNRLLAQVEQRLAVGQLRTAQMLEAAWALYEIHPGCEHPLASKLMAEAARRVRTEGPERMCEAFHVVSGLPMRRPLPLVEPLAAALRAVPPPFEADQLVKLYDALARMRYDGPSLLAALEQRAQELLSRSSLHEAQAASIIESLALLNFAGSLQIVPALLLRLQNAPLLLPPTVTAALHGAAQLRLVPVAPCGPAELLGLMDKSLLPLELCELGVLGWSLIELGQAELAAGVMRGLGPELLERVGGADLHSLLMSLWSLLNLQLHEHPLVAPLVATLCKVGVGVRLPVHVGLLVEIALMLQFEAPPQLGLKLPPELCLQAHQAHLRQQQNAAGPPGPMLRGVAAALDALRLRYQLQVCFATAQVTNSFLLDAALSREDTGGALVGLMLHPPHHYTSQRELLGKVRLAQRLLQCQGWAVVSVSVLEWNELRSHEDAVSLLRKLIQPHVRQQQPQQPQQQPPLPQQ